MGVFWLLVLFTNWSLRWCLTHSRCSVCVYWWLSDIASLFAPKGPCSSTRGTAVTGRVPAAGLRPLCQRVLRAPPDGTCRPAGALHAGLVSLLFQPALEELPGLRVDQRAAGTVRAPEAGSRAVLLLLQADRPAAG
ncbi:transmembrane protein 138 isoform X6 [Heterocephalus glaber]|uniref:Transmembrane protein 138 isoform X6 n=1 Tax=Heterocephalus glaber TaxID=10181 RepID=A0AAX6SHD5_HETGA|nr:transmembrane protein 138 isoform X6 [Heterocephalus glaber]